MTKETDEILMRQLRRGELSALGFLYERYKSLLYTYFLRITGDRALSDDLLMNTYERVYRYRQTFKESAAFKPWLYQIANNLLKDEFKRQNRFRNKEKMLKENEIAMVSSPNDDQERKSLLLKALMKLKPDEQRIIQLYYLLEMPYEEISSLEKITINTARIRVCRALKKLNQLLKNSGI